MHEKDDSYSLGDTAKEYSPYLQEELGYARARYEFSETNFIHEKA